MAEIRRRWFGEGAVPPPRVLDALAEDPRSACARLLELARARLARQGKLRRRSLRLLAREKALWKEGYRCIAGVDEVGMGPLAGPVVAAAVILPPGCRIDGIDDSKTLTHEQRTFLDGQIRKVAVSVAMEGVDAAGVDRHNVYQAGLMAMGGAIRALDCEPDYLLVDARRLADIPIPQEAIIKGDARSASIAAASIVAKVERDRMMAEFDRLYPGYGFATHKGYATLSHRQAVISLGPSPIHRKSFLIKEMETAQGKLFPTGDTI